MRAHLLLLVLGVAVWARSIHNSTVNHDTPWLVVNNPLLTPGDPAVIPTIFTDFSLGTRLLLGAEYLPFRDLTVLLDFAIFGSSWWGHHATSLAWYLLSCSLLLVLFGKLLPDTRQAWLAAALFTVHPLHVESVSWLAGRKDVVSLAFFFGGLLAGLRGGWRWGGAAVACFAVSYWSKNTAITLPAIAVLLSLLHLRQSPRHPMWWLRWVPLGLVALTGLVLTMHVGGMVAMMSPERAPTAWGIFTIEVQVILRYLGMMLWPASLSIHYPEPGVAALTEPAFLLGLLLIGGLLAAAARWRKTPLLSLGILWFFVTLLPVSQIVPIQNLLADRYLLLPSAGLILAGVSLIPPDALRRAPGMIAAGVVIALLSAGTWSRCGVWHSSERLWSDLVEKHPDNPDGWTALAGLAVESGELERAEALVEQGMQAAPGAPLLQSQGLVRMGQGDLTGAEASFRAALELSGGLRKSKYNLMLSLHRQGRLREAALLGQELVAEHPLYEIGWNGLGAVYIDLGKPEAALTSLQRAYDLNPYDISTVTNMGNAAFLLGDHELARKMWQEVLRLDPDNDYARRGLEALQ